MITARGTEAEMIALGNKLDIEEGYPNPATLTERYARRELDETDYVMVLLDSDETRAKKHHKGKVEKGDTRKPKGNP